MSIVNFILNRMKKDGTAVLSEDDTSSEDIPTRRFGAEFEVKKNNRKASPVTNKSKESQKPKASRGVAPSSHSSTATDYSSGNRGSGNGYVAEYAEQTFDSIQDALDSIDAFTKQHQFQIFTRNSTKKDLKKTNEEKYTIYFGCKRGFDSSRPDKKGSKKRKADDIDDDSDSNAKERKRKAAAKCGCSYSLKLQYYKEKERDALNKISVTCMSSAHNHERNHDIKMDDAPDSTSKQFKSVTKRFTPSD